MYKTVKSLGSCSKTSEEYQQNIDAWWGDGKKQSSNNAITNSDSDEEVEVYFINYKY